MLVQIFWARILKFSLTFSVILDPEMHRKHGSSVVRGPSLVLEVPSLIPACSKIPNTLSLVSFAGMTLDLSIDLRMGTLTGCPLCRESHPLCRLKNPVGFILQPTVYNVHLPIMLESKSQAIYIERKHTLCSWTHRGST